MFGDAVRWVEEKLGPAWQLLDELWPPVLVAILAIVLLRVIRQLVLFWRGRTARVQISPFAWTAAEKDDREATWVTSLFREQLAALRLDALDPLPERAPGAPLVEIVEGVGQGVGRNLDIGKAVGRLYRTVWPDAAYEVWGTLRPCEDGSGRISVQLVDRRAGNRTLLNIALEEASWEKGAREAAMAVAGALYPRVRSRDRGPWARWKEPVPRKLLSDYHTAREHEAANRLEQALDRYHATLDQDPLNPNLRLKIAMLLERLELDLDAWVTYEAIVDESDRRVWRGPDRRVYLLAHYRLAILLGNGRVPEQWVKNEVAGESGKGTLRDVERHEHRKELMMSLKRNQLLTETRALPTANLVRASAAGLMAKLRAAGGEKNDEGAMLKPFKTPLGDLDSQREQREQLIDSVLQIVSLRRLEELDAWLRIHPPGWRGRWPDWRVHRPPLRRWLQRREFARSAVRASKLLVRLRIAASFERRHREHPGSDDSEIVKIRKAHRKLTKRWPFPPVGIWRRTTFNVAPRRWLTDFRADAWQLHYNAACTAASVLRPDSVLANEKAERHRGQAEQKQALPDGTERGEVIRCAIDELEDYAYRAGSERVAAQADWLAIDDPDLIGLRDTSEFRLWASHHLPRGLPPKRPSRKTNVKRFTVRVLHQGARAFAESWRQRANAQEASAAEIAVWWREERRAWEILRRSCHQHLSWSERLEGVKALQAWLDTMERPSRIDFGHEARGDTTAATRLTDDLLDRLVELAGERPGPPTPVSSRRKPKLRNPAVLPWVHGRVEHVCAAYEGGEERADTSGTLLADVEREEALRAFRIWTRLADALAAELNGPRPGMEVASLGKRLDRVRDNLPARRPRQTARWPNFSRMRW